MSGLAVRAAERGDCGAIAGLLAEMDRFYGDATAGTVEERAREIGQALFSESPAGSALLAWDGDVLAGLAAYSFVWPAVGLTRSLYLKELYVGQGYRRRGVGRLLMGALFEVASGHACSRVEWTTDRGNAGAQAFYAMLGVPVRESKLFYRVEDTGKGFTLPEFPT